MTKLPEITQEIQFEKLRYDMVVAPKSQQNRAKASDTYNHLSNKLILV